MVDQTGSAASRKHNIKAPPTVLAPYAFFASTGNSRSILTFPSGGVVFSQGAAADAVFYINTGKILLLTVVSDQGKEGVIAQFGPGDCFGEGCLAGQPVRLASASAAVSSNITRIEKAAMIRLLHDEPGFSESFMGFLLSRNREARRVFCNEHPQPAC